MCMYLESTINGFSINLSTPVLVANFLILYSLVVILKVLVGTSFILFFPLEFIFTLPHNFRASLAHSRENHSFGISIKIVVTI